jgi:VanZ family protein
VPSLFRSKWLPLAWAAVMLALSGIPGNYIPRVVSFREWLGPDKFVHLAMFGILALLLLAGPAQQYLERFNRFLVGIIVLALGTIFGFILEALQRYVFVGRNGNPYDLAADILGLLVGIAAFYIFFERKERTDTK